MTSSHHPHLRTRLRVLAALAALVAILAAGRAGGASDVLWTGTLETGDLSEWAAGQSGVEFNSGQGYSETSRDFAHSGSWSQKLVMPRGSDGVRLFRYKESRTGADLEYSSWYLIPKAYDIPAGWWNVFQFKSKSEDGTKNDPFFSFNLKKVSGGYSVAVYKKPEGYFLPNRATVVVPVGQWFQIKAFLHQSASGAGSIVVWVNGTEITRADGLTTKYPGNSQQNWSVNNYSDGVSPAPVTLYVDDARVDLPGSSTTTTPATTTSTTTTPTTTTTTTPTATTPTTTTTTTTTTPTTPTTTTTAPQTTTSAPPADTTAPTAPTQLYAVVYRGHRVEIAWRQASDDVGVVAYRIYRDDVRLGEVPDPLYRDEPKRGTYTYTVRAVDAAGNVSPLSTPLVVDT